MYIDVFMTELCRACSANRGLMSAMVRDSRRLFSALICRMSLSSYLGEGRGGGRGMH